MKSKIPTSNPFVSQNRFWTKQFWISFFKPVDPKQWHNPVRQIITEMKNKIGKSSDNSFFLKKGTLLFHGSTRKNLKFDSKKSITFFGLDIIISLWYILEEVYMKNDLKKSDARINGYVYVFEVIENIPITKILKILNVNPKDRNSGCEQDLYTVCLHPQVAFHGSSVETIMRSVVPLFDLSCEVTLNYNTFKDYLNLKEIYNVNPVILHENATNPSFNPIDSITDGEIFPEKISRMKYLELFYNKQFTKQEFIKIFKN